MDRHTNTILLLKQQKKYPAKKRDISTIINNIKAYFFSFSFISILRVAWGTTLSLSFGISNPVSRQIP